MKKQLFVGLMLIQLFSALPANAFTPTLNGIMHQSNVNANTFAHAVFNFDEDTDDYADYTDEAEDIGDDDVILPDDETMLYIGSEFIFDEVSFDITTAGDSSNSNSTKHYTLEYYTLSGTWTNLDFTDNTGDFEEEGTDSIEFDVPTAWKSSLYTQPTINGEKMFWIRMDAKSGTSVSSPARAAQVALRGYNFELTVESETGDELEDDLVKGDFEITGGTLNTLEAFKDNGDGVYLLALHNHANDSNYTVEVSMDGYVTDSLATGDLSGKSAVVEEYLALQYSHIIQVKNESGTYIVPDTVIAGGVTCDVGAVFAYCALSTSKDGSSGDPGSVVVTRDDYESKTVELDDERDSNDDAQVVTVVTLEKDDDSSSGSSSGSDDTDTGYVSIKVINEDGDSIKTLDEDNFNVSGGTDNDIYGFTNNNNGTYILILAVGTSDDTYSIKIVHDGYVALTQSTGNMDTGTTYMSLSLDFSYKVKVEDEDGDDISKATVKAGDDFSVTCEYLGSGYYGCKVPLDDDDIKYKVTASGYEREIGSFYSDRDSHSDSQQVANVELEEDEDGCEHPFDDIYGHWAEEEIESLYCRDIVEGRDSNEFEPSSSITRAEFLKIALLNAGYDVDGANDEEFSDVSSGDWYYEYVSLAYDRDFVRGYEDETFHPNDPINRAEALVMLLRIAGQTLYGFDDGDIPFDDVDADEWFAYAVVIGYNDGLIEGYDDDTFRPENEISRAEVAVLAVRAYEAYYD